MRIVNTADVLTPIGFSISNETLASSFYQHVVDLGTCLFIWRSPYINSVQDSMYQHPPRMMSKVGVDHG